jgi:hypothetical protein
MGCAALVLHAAFPAPAQTIGSASGRPANILVLGGGGQSTQAGTAFAQPLVVQVLDAYGAGVPFASVTFTGAGYQFTNMGSSAVSPSGGATGFLADQAGMISVSATPTLAGTAPVIVSVAPGSASSGGGIGPVMGGSGSGAPPGAAPAPSGPPVVITFPETCLPGPAANLSLSAGDGQSALVGTTFLNPLMVQVSDRYGNPVPGQDVAFAGTGLSLVGGPNLGAASGPSASFTLVSDANGRASILAMPELAGPVQAMATLGALAQVQFNETGTPDLPAGIVAASGDGQTAAAGTPFSSSLVAKVTGSVGQPLPNIIVTFSGPGLSFSSTTASTDVSGQASVSATPTAVGALTAKASVSGLDATADFTQETGTPGSPATITLVAGTDQTAIVGQPFAQPVVALVADSYGNPVPGYPVTFSGDGFQFDPVTAVTGADGKASTTATPTSADTLTLSAGGATLSTPATGTGTGTPDLPTSLTVVSGGNQSTQVGTVFANPLVVKVTDTLGQPMPGVTVTFSGTGVTFSGASGSTSISLGGATPSNSGGGGSTSSSGTGGSTSISGTGGSTSTSTGGGSTSITSTGTTTSFTVTSGTDGQASVVATPSSVGPLTVSADVNGLTTVTFAETVTPDLPASLTVVSGSGQSAPVGTAFPAPLVIQVNDSRGLPLPGAAVSFAGSSLSFSNASATTDANGQASSTATPTASGALTASASVAGLTPVTFQETATAVTVPAFIRVVSGAHQRALVGSAFTQPLVVQVTDARRRPVPNVTVTFAGAGLAFLPGATAVTGPTGLASVQAKPTAFGKLLGTASVHGIARQAKFHERGIRTPDRPTRESDNDEDRDDD